MCGFFGVFSRQPSLSVEKIERLRSILLHRGPDDQQMLSGSGYEMMFWRLSIVDQDGGKQPMVSSDSRITLLFNGEIYNFKSLRRELSHLGCQFLTESDTETALMAYQVWGSQCFRRFEGMFAICIVDRVRGKVLLTRDRLGVKPLYFSLINSSLIVASEQKALLAYDDRYARLDRNSFLQYFIFQTVLGSGTLFSGIQKVIPGWIMEFRLDDPVMLGCQQMQQDDAIDNERSSYEEYSHQLHQVILEQTKLTLDTDLPICFHLSGGLDSNALISLSRHLNPGANFTTVSSVVEGEEDDEWKFIQESARYYRCPHRVVSIDEEKFFSSLDDVVYHLDEPVGDPGVVAQFMVNALASQEAKIVYSGQGFDEMFFGYTRDLAVYALEAYGEGALRHQGRMPQSTQQFLEGWEPFLETISETPPLQPEWALFRKLCRFDPMHKGPLSGDFLNALRSVALDEFVRLRGETSTLHDFILQAETLIQLPSLLHMEDRASMRYSLETRVPFCTASILDLASNGCLEWKFVDGMPKGILRALFRDILPPHIGKRNKKVGRPIPFRKWLVGQYGRPHLESLNASKDLFYELSGTNLLEYALDHQNPYDRSAWGLLSLLRWMDIYNVRL
jgi:asparagine synthase (glutamine-hydrolysing)